MVALLGFQHRTFLNTISQSQYLCTRKFDTSQDYEEVDVSNTCGLGDAGRLPGFRGRVINAQFNYDRSLALFNPAVRAFAGRDPSRLMIWPNISNIDLVGTTTANEQYLYYGYIFNSKLSAEIKGNILLDIVWKSAFGAKAAYTLASPPEGPVAGPVTGLLAPILSWQSAIVVQSRGDPVVLCVRRWELETTYEEVDVSGTCSVVTQPDISGGDAWGVTTDPRQFAEIDRLPGLRTSTLTCEAYFDPTQNPFLTASPQLHNGFPTTIAPIVAGEAVGMPYVGDGFVFNTKIMGEVNGAMTYSFTFKSSKGL